MIVRENFYEAFRIVLRLSGCWGVQQSHGLHEVVALPAASRAEFSPKPGCRL
jgi:hypothetical protein